MNKLSKWLPIVACIFLFTPQLFKNNLYAQKWCKRVPGESNNNRFEVTGKRFEYPFTMFNKNDPGWKGLEHAIGQIQIRIKQGAQEQNKPESLTTTTICSADRFNNSFFRIESHKILQPNVFNRTFNAQKWCKRVYTYSSSFLTLFGSPPKCSILVNRPFRSTRTYVSIPPSTYFPVNFFVGALHHAKYSNSI